MTYGPSVARFMQNNRQLTISALARPSSVNKIFSTPPLLSLILLQSFDIALDYVGECYELHELNELLMHVGETALNLTS